MSPDAQDAGPPPDRVSPDAGPDAPPADPGHGALFDPEAVPVLYLELEQEDWYGALWDVWPEDPWRCSFDYAHAEFRFADPGSGVEEVVRDVGVRFRGHHDPPRDYPYDERVGYQIQFDEFDLARRYRGLCGLETFGDDGDPSLMLQCLAHRTYAAFGAVAPRCNHARLVVNGEDLGLHAHLETVDNPCFLGNRFGDDSGNHYEIDGDCGCPSTLRWLGEGEESMEAWLCEYWPIAGTPIDAPLDDLEPMLRCTEERSDGAFRACIMDWIDVELWLRTIAVELATPNLDGMSSDGDNFYLYRRPDTGLFVPVLYDQDEAFDARNPDYPVLGTGASPLLVRRLIDAWREEYCALIDELTATVLSDDGFAAIFDPMFELMAPHMETDPIYDPDLWAAAARLYPDQVVPARRAALAAQLDTCLTDRATGP